MEFPGGAGECEQHADIDMPSDVELQSELHGSQQHHKSWKCDCGKVYNQQRNLKRHQIACKTKKKRSFTKCSYPGCTQTFYHTTSLVAHLVTNHAVTVAKSTMQFANKKLFMEWKEREESEKFSYFSKQKGVHRTANAVYTYYVCQYSGSDKLHRKKNVEKKTCRVNKKGRSKTGHHCPARMLVKEQDGQIMVTYISSHSHTLEFRNTQHHPLPSHSLQAIKQQLALGIPPREVQAQLRQGVCSRNTRGDDNSFTKQQLVTLRRLNEMKRRLVANGRLHSDDATSVMLKVEQLQQEEYNPILLYKPQGANFKKVGKHTPLYTNEQLTQKQFEDSFVLGLQTREQNEVMKLGCEKIVCIDSTHCTNKYDFYLINVVVPDEFGKGYPVAHFICNRQDEEAMTWMMESLRVTNEHMVLNAVMTDDDLAVVNALHAVFGRNIRHLLCIWHVHRAWLRKLRQSVSYESERSDMYRDLCTLLYEKNEVTFKMLCDAFCKTYSQFGDFVSYFKQRYMVRYEKWALCMRNFPHADTDTNMYVESFHNRLKTFFMERRPNKRVDDLMDLLLKIEEDDYMRRKSMLLYSNDKLKNTPDNNNRHSRALQISNDDVTVISNTSWNVKAQSGKATWYTVTRIATECMNDMCVLRCLELACLGLCHHLYSCTCNDQHTICKHVHKVHMTVVRHDNKASTHLFTDADESKFQLFDVPDGPVNTSVQRNDAIVADIIKKLAELQAFVDEDQLSPLLLGHIDGTLSKLVLQCAAVANAHITIPKQMTEKQLFHPNERLHTQSAPSQMHRTQKQRHNNDEVNENNTSTGATVIDSIGNGGVTSKRHFNSKLSIKKRQSSNQNVMVNTNSSSQISPFTPPLDFVSNIRQTVIRINKISLTLLHLKSLENCMSQPEANILKQADNQFRQGWLYDSVIDAYLTTICSPYMLVIDAAVPQLILQKRSVQQVFGQVCTTNIANVLFPCNASGKHWTLYIADILHKQMIYCNSLHSTPTSEEHSVFQGLCHLVDSQFATTGAGTWQLSLPPVEKQTDGNSCGVFVCWYAHRLVNHLPFTDSTFNPKVFRKDIYNALVGNCLQRPHFSDQTCSLCRRNPLQSDEWVQCDRCEQWLHCACARVSFNEIKHKAFICSDSVILCDSL